MRKLSRYKSVKKSKVVFRNSPLRILSFKRPKWSFLQKKLNRLVSKKKTSKTKISCDNFVAKQFLFKNFLSTLKILIKIKNRTLVTRSLLKKKLFSLKEKKEFSIKMKQLPLNKSLINISNSFNDVHYNHVKDLNHLHSSSKLIEDQKINSSEKKKISKIKRFKSKRSFLNPFLVKSNLRSLTRVKQYLKEAFSTRNKLNVLYDNSIPFSLFKRKQFTVIKQNLLHFFVRPHYKIDVLLWNLFFSNSVYEARQLIQTKKILVNNLPVTQSFQLKKGDVLEILVCKFFPEKLLRQIRAKYLKSQKLLTFLEVDYFTRTVVVFKDYDEFSSKDLYLLSIDFIRLRDLYLAS